MGKLDIRIVRSSYKQGNVGRCSIAISLFKSFVGLGILALPSTFSKIGLLGGIIGVLILAQVNLYS